MDTNAAKRRRNRSWPEALKREIVAASFAPGSSVSIVARRYDVNANQVFGWRKRYRDDPRLPSAPLEPRLIPVQIAAEPTAVGARESSGVQKIEIEVAGRYRVCVGSNFDGQALRRVLDELERR
jgi:transposase